ncbi:ATP-binding protein [Embleya scabrispora]|uniref:ATP-binding protein n=1 Tax=Embleya scabrispora TaxID=159449 RepID=UPI0013750278|nr:ATP-binding protein [Embleya scabrispora]
MPGRSKRFPGRGRSILCLTAGNTPSDVGGSRNVVAETLKTWSAPEDVREWATLVVSELLTNAIDHARCASAMVVLFAGADEFVIVVVNDGLPPTRSLTEVDPARDDAEGGRGLFLVAATSTRFGATRRLGRTIVWAGRTDQPPHTPACPTPRDRPRRCRGPRIGRRTRGRTGGNRR